MKQLLIFLFSIPLFADAQNCELKKEIDPFSQLPHLSTGFIRLGEGQLLLSAEADSKEILFNFAPPGGGESDCYDATSTITFIYEGGRLKNWFKNAGSMNCRGLLQLSFRNTAGTPGNLKRLTTNKVIQIKLLDNKQKERVIDLSEPEQQLLMEKITCLLDEAKTLLK